MCVTTRNTRVGQAQHDALPKTGVLYVLAHLHVLSLQHGPGMSRNKVTAQQSSQPLCLDVVARCNRSALDQLGHLVHQTARLRLVALRSVLAFGLWSSLYNKYSCQQESSQRQESELVNSCLKPALGCQSLLKSQVTATHIGCSSRATSFAQ